MSSSDGQAPIGIFGGTFDPVHRAHLQLAEEAMGALALSALIWVPAGQPPLRDAPNASAPHRLAMVERAIAGHPGFVLDNVEVTSTQPSYTVHTLERLRRTYGAAHPLVLLLGADAFLRLEGWFEWRRVFELAHIGLATRPGYDFTKVGDGGTAIGDEFVRRRAPADALAQAPAGCIVPFPITPMDISATAIRARLLSGQSIQNLMSEAVLDYIEQNHLYR